MDQPTSPQTTDAWPTGKIIKHILLPKPKGSPRAGKKEIALRILIGLLCGAATLAFVLNRKSLPECDQAETKTLLGKIINDLPAAKAVNAQFVTVKEVAEKGYNKADGLRLCTAVLVTTRGEDDLQYAVRWQDKSRGIFHVEAQILTAGASAQEDVDPFAQAAVDAVKQFEMTRRNGTPIDICTRAMMVSAAFLEAKDEGNYGNWKDVERQVCRAAGMPGY